MGYISMTLRRNIYGIMPQKHVYCGIKAMLLV